MAVVVFDFGLTCIWSKNQLWSSEGKPEREGQSAAGARADPAPRGSGRREFEVHRLVEGELIRGDYRVLLGDLLLLSREIIDCVLPKYIQ